LHLQKTRYEIGKLTESILDYWARGQRITGDW
jgi:hypothetical protein